MSLISEVYYKGKLLHTIVHPKSVKDEREAELDVRDGIVIKTSNRESGFTLVELLVVLVIIAIVISLGVGYFRGYGLRTDVESTVRTLTTQNYTHVEITGFRYFGCSEDDWYHTGFTATAPDGQTVSGIACKGYSRFGKGTTVRFD